MVEIYQEIIIKFKEGGFLEEKEGKLHAPHLSLLNFYRTLQSIKGAKVHKSFHTRSKRMHKLRDQAVKRLHRQVPNLDLFVRVSLPKRVDIEEVVKWFEEDLEVEYACIAGISTPFKDK
jgi:hypothetical protein